MKKIFVISTILVIALVASVVPSYAAFSGQVTDNGPHFNLNIIGVPHGKTANMSNMDRHTVFVPMDKPCKITIQANTADPTAFAVLDGNGTDGQTVIAVPYTIYGTLSYNVWAIALGKPNGNTHVDATVVFDDNTYGALLQTSFDLARKNGKPTVQNISDIFTASGYIVNPDGTITTFDNVWVFNVPSLLDYYWTYTNDGLKLMQLRFYETSSGNWTGIPQ
jgi:hypothetical protein